VLVVVTLLVVLVFSCAGAAANKKISPGADDAAIATTVAILKAILEFRLRKL
jgi:hypothetical protein